MKRYYAVLGFTRNEKTVLLFLVLSFIVGTGVWIYRQYYEPLPVISEHIVNEEIITYRQSSEIEQNLEETRNPNRLISINEATQEQLEQLPGIGPVTAERIIAYRERHNGFQAIDELIEIKGIGQKTVENLKPYLQVVE